MKSSGFSLLELLIILALTSSLLALCLNSNTYFQIIYSAKSFAAQLESAVSLAQALSLSRQDDLEICAEQQHLCQKNWHGTLSILSHNHTILASFGPTPNNLHLNFKAFNNQQYLLIQDHGLSINNGTFTISNQNNKVIATLTISKEGIINFAETK